MSNHHRHHPHNSNQSESSSNHHHARDLYTEPFRLIENRKSLVMQQKEQYFREKRIHELRQHVEERLKREGGISGVDEDGHHDKKDSPSIDTSKLLGEITYSLEEKLRTSIRKELQMEQKREMHEKREKFSQMDQHLAEEIATKICAVCFELMRAPDHSPMILFPCGHTFCSQCCKMLVDRHGSRKCPECRAKIESHAVNIPLKQIIESYVEKERELKERDRAERLQVMEHHNVRDSTTASSNDFSIENKLDSVMSSILNDLSGEAQQTAKRYYNDYKKFSLRSQLLQLELKEVQDELKSLDKKEEKTKHRIQTAQQEEGAIRKDIEMLMQGLEELQQQLKSSLDEEKELNNQRKSSSKKIEMISTTLQSVESQKEKSIVLLQKFVPHARRLEFE